MALSTTQYGYIIDPMVPFTDDKGKTIKNGFVRVFVAGSSTPVVTYRNFDGATNQDRIELDNSGRTKTSVIGSKGFTYKVCVYDKHHSQESPIQTVDKVSVIGANITAGAGATLVTGLDGLTTKPDGFVDASVVGTDGYVAIDHTLVTDNLDTDAKVTAVEDDRYVPLLNKDVNDPDSKMTLGRMWQWVLGKIKSLSTTITAFRTGDVIPVDGPSGTAKMSKDDLLRVTAENALAGNVARIFNVTKDYEIGEKVINDGKDYVFVRTHSAGAFSTTDAVQLPYETRILPIGYLISDGIYIDKNDDYKVTANSSQHCVYFPVVTGDRVIVSCDIAPGQLIRYGHVSDVPSVGDIATDYGEISSAGNYIITANSDGYIMISVYGPFAYLGLFSLSTIDKNLDDMKDIDKVIAGIQDALNPINSLTGLMDYHDGWVTGAGKWEVHDPSYQIAVLPVNPSDVVRMKGVNGGITNVFFVKTYTALAPNQTVDFSSAPGYDAKIAISSSVIEEYIVPLDTHYIIFDILQNNSSKAPQYLSINSNYNLAKNLLDNLNDMVAGSSFVRWRGKKIAFLGDSFTARALEPGYYSFVNNIQNITGCIPLNYGASGTGFTKTYGANGDFDSRASSIDNSADMVFVLGCINDFDCNYLSSYAVQVGSVTDSTTDPTFCGKVKKTIEDLLTRFPDKHVIFASSPKCASEALRIREGYAYYGKDANPNGATLEDFVNAYKSCCELYGVPFLDLFHDSGMNDFTIPELTDDGLHPNEDGCNFISYKIANFIETC